MPFLVFWEDNFCRRCSLNWLPFYAYFYLPGFMYKYSILFYISCGFKSFLDISFSWVYSVGKIRTDVKNRVFPIPIAYWSGCGIFKQNWENPTKLGWLDSLYMRAEAEVAARGVWGHATIENVTKILTLWNAISSVQRGQFSSKTFAKLIAIFNLHYCLRGFTCKYSTLC